MSSPGEGGRKKYTVAIPRRIERKLVDSNLGSRLIRLLLERIADQFATGDLDEIGRRIVAPVSCVVSRFELVDPETKEEHDCWIWIDDYEAPDIRIVREIRCDSLGIGSGCRKVS